MKGNRSVGIPHEGAARPVLYRGLNGYDESLFQVTVGSLAMSCSEKVKKP